MSVLQTASGLIKSVTSIPRKVFGTRNDRILKGYRRHVLQINALEEEVRADFDQRFESRVTEMGIDALPTQEREESLRALRVELSRDLLDRAKQLRQHTQEMFHPLEDWWRSLDPLQRVEEYFRVEYRKRNAKLLEVLDAEGVTSESFAVLREASRRAKDHRHFDCQLIGGRVLFEGKIAEMKTGEGKTIVCHLAAFFNHLCGRKVHVITVNDYLVKRDAEFATAIFELVGISVGYIQSQVDPGGREGVRQHAYDCDMTFGTNSEFGFDYLRDNMKTQLADQVQGRLDFVVVDEVDSILIDEARTPLIISGPASDDVSRYPRADKVAEELVRRQAPWDRKVLASVEKFDGNTHNIQKLEDAMKILGYRASKASKNEGSKDDQDEAVAALGPDFLTDDQVEAVQIYENDILQVPPSEQYRRFFIVQRERKQVGLTHDGVSIAQELLDIGSLYSGANMEWPHLIENALRAHKVYRRDADYVVQEGEVVIVDVFTGRLMVGRQWSDGLHQSIEAKERVKVKEETQTLATITIQNFIKLYFLKAGMTGTALTEANEFDKIYKLDVVEIPTNRPINRTDNNDAMYRDTDQKFSAIVDEIHEIHRRGRPADPFVMADVLKAMRPIQLKLDNDTSKIDEAIRRFNGAEMGDKSVIQFMIDTYDECLSDLPGGRPILVGTTSVENSEKLSKLLTRRYGIEHEVLNAKNHAREADIVAKAGERSIPAQGGDQNPRGNVTIATNMAGRGTDIKLGLDVVYARCKVPEVSPDGVQSSPLYPIGVTKCCMHCEEYDPSTNCAHCFKPKLDPRFPELGRKVCVINVPCGLHIIGTERHESRRIDNQLRGRAGRQGDPGSSRFSLSLEDDLLKLFMPDWMLKMMDKLGFADGGSLEDKRLTKGIERAQRKVEERNFSTRKHLLDWDEPMDFQRKEFYSARQRILEENDLPGLIFTTVDRAIETAMQDYLGGQYHKSCIVEWCRVNLDLSMDLGVIDDSDLSTTKRSIREFAKDEAVDQIRTSMGEYIDPDDPPSKWDVGGLLQWARRAYKISMTQNQLRKMEPSEIEDVFCEAARTFYDGIDLAGIEVFLENNYAQRAMVTWAKSKFNMDLDVDELVNHTLDEIGRLIDERVHKAYLQREIEYPVETCLDRAFGGENPDHATAAEALVHWVNQKYDIGWTTEQVQGKRMVQLREELTALSESFLNGRLEQYIEEKTAGMDSDAAVEWAAKRYGGVWNAARLEHAGGDVKAALLATGREMLRWELTRLEQYVLLRLYDQAWKDHLLEMDHLKHAIMQRPMGGDQTHPQSQFAIEGRDLFRQMWARIATRVTDIIFKVKITGGDDEAGGEAGVPSGSSGPSGSGGPAMSFGHADSTGTGFAGVDADRSAAMKAQGEGKVETIRRETPKVGRNDPCPCGSGKKYKQCHGRSN